MRNLDIVDTREKLEIYAKAGLLSLGAGAALASLGQEAALSKTSKVTTASTEKIKKN